jgi:hypothetical protein
VLDAAGKILRPGGGEVMPGATLESEFNTEGMSASDESLSEGGVAAPLRSSGPRDRGFGEEIIA